jgi:hypothetical protein
MHPKVSAMKILHYTCLISQTRKPMQLLSPAPEGADHIVETELPQVCNVRGDVERCAVPTTAIAVVRVDVSKRPQQHRRTSILHENVAGCARLNVNAGDLVVQIGTDVGARPVRVKHIDAGALEVYGWAKLYGTSTLHDKKQQWERRQ